MSANVLRAAGCYNASMTYDELVLEIQRTLNAGGNILRLPAETEIDLSKLRHSLDADRVDQCPYCHVTDESPRLTCEHCGAIPDDPK